MLPNAGVMSAPDITKPNMKLALEGMRDAVATLQNRQCSLALLPLQAGDFVDAARIGLTNTAVVLAANVLEAFPVKFDQTITVDQLGIAISTATPGGLISLGLYSSNPDNTPHQRLAQTGGAGLPTDTATLVGANIGSVVLQENTLYWLAVNSTTSTVSVRAINAGASLGVGPLASASSTLYFNRLRQSLAWSADLPEFWGAYSPSQRGTGHVPSIRMRVAA